jgi:hypothetical protein
MKKGIGALFILGGVALIGLYWFKKNKPTVASSQAKELEALSNSYKAGTSDQPQEKGQNTDICKYGELRINGLCQNMLTNLNYNNLSVKEKEDLKKSLQGVGDFNFSIPPNIDLSNLDFSKYDFSKINVKDLSPADLLFFNLKKSVNSLV